jgi:archaellum component FlaG (FlaF/FlaG flagellin family)
VISPSREACRLDAVTSEQVWSTAAGLAAGLVAVVALVALLVAVRARARATRAEETAAALAERVAVLESPAEVASAAVDDAGAGTYVITGVGTDVAAQPADRDTVAARIDGRLFADVVARETVVKAASWSHGLRRALSAENRNRIRFQVRQETRRATRERRAETRQALREFRARQRADLGAAVGEDVA